MGDYEGSYNYVAEGEGEGEVEYVKDADHEDWRLMRITDEPADADTAVVEIGGEESYYEDDANYQAESAYNFEVEFSYDYETSRQQAAATEGGASYGTHRRVHSSFNGHTGNSLLEDDQSRFSSESRDEKVKTGKPKTKKTKKKSGGVGRQFDQIQEVTDSDTHSDPGYGYVDGYDARNQSIDLVSSWLRDASLEDAHHYEGAPQHNGHAPPTRHPPPRRHAPRPEIVARTASMPNHHGHYETYPPDVHYNGSKSLPYGSYSYEDHNNQLAIFDANGSASVAGSAYRFEEIKPLAGRAYQIVKMGAGRFATVSRTAAVNLKHKSIEFKNLAVPVMKPIFNAVIEESMVQLYGPNGDPSLGRGRGGMARPMLRPGMRPVMRPGMMVPDLRPAMRPGMVVPGLGGQRPAMRPRMQVPAQIRPPMRPGMRAGMAAGARGQQSRPVVRPTGAY